MTDMERPEEGQVFTQTNGEKVRIEFSKVSAYSSKEKGTTTVVDYGWDDKKKFIIDLDFESFDAILEASKKAWRKYYDASSNDYYRD